MIRERRATQRAPIQQPVLMQASAEGGPEAVIQATTDDLSSVAFRCVCDKPLAPFSRVSVVIKLPSDDVHGSDELSSIQCDGLVVRREDVVMPDGAQGYALAVFLDHTTPEQREALELAVGRHLGGPQAAAANSA